MHKIKLICSDMDGTILDQQHVIPDKTKQLIRLLDQKQIRFMLASARPTKGMIGLIQDLGVHIPLIGCNGALIWEWDVEQNKYKTIRSITFTPQTLAKLNSLLVLVDDSLVVNYYIDEDRFSLKAVDGYQSQRETRLTGVAAQAITSPDHLRGVNKISVMGDMQLIVDLQTLLHQAVPDLNIVLSAPHILEINSPNASKANALQFMQLHYNLQQENLLAFGDNFNDVDMLEYAQIGVAMGNAPDAIKQIADRVTRTNIDNGVGLILQELLEELDNEH